MTPYVKDAFPRLSDSRPEGRRQSGKRGTKAAALYRLEIPAGGSATFVCG